MSKQRYPLVWPVGYARTVKEGRSKFGRWSLNSAVETLLNELRMMGAKNVIISSNVPLRGDGLPASSYKKGELIDKGVAVYFDYQDRSSVLCCDKWDSVEHNVYGIALSVEAMRGLARWGVSEILERTFTGFAALPEKASGRSCWEVLGIECIKDISEITAAYKKRSMQCHPDMGGSHEQMVELNEAYEEAKKYAGGVV